VGKQAPSEECACSGGVRVITIVISNEKKAKLIERPICQQCKSHLILVKHITGYQTIFAWEKNCNCDDYILCGLPEADVIRKHAPDVNTVLPLLCDCGGE
jgi:hypothetical protein